MNYKIPDKLTFKRREVAIITKLDGRVIDFWEKEFGGFCSTENKEGDKFYSKRDLEIILEIKQLFIIEKIGKGKVKEIMKNKYDQYVGGEPSHPQRKIDPDTLKKIRSNLKEILTILDKNDK
jgi:hypothetical protein